MARYKPSTSTSTVTKNGNEKRIRFSSAVFPYFVLVAVLVLVLGFWSARPRPLFPSHPPPDPLGSLRTTHHAMKGDPMPKKTKKPSASKPKNTVDLTSAAKALPSSALPIH